MAQLTKRAKYNRISAFDVVLSLFMIAFMACIVLPFVHVIAISLSDNMAVVNNQVSFWPKGFTLNTYITMLSKGDFIQAYGVTIFVTVVGTAISLTITAMCAYALSTRRMVGHNLFTMMITITMFFSGGMIPSYVNLNNLGMIDSVWALILPNALNTWNMIIMRSFFIAYPKEITESGQIDGLQDAGVFFRLVLPTSKAALATIGLYYAVAYWNAYMPAKMYLPTRHDLRPVQYLLQVMIDSVGQDELGQGELVAATVRNASIMIVITPIMCVYPFLQKHFVKGVMVGSVKG